MTLPPPDPDRLDRLGPAIFVLAPHVTLWRIYRSAGPYPATWNGFRHFGPIPSRFDHHQLDGSGEPFEQDRGILYAASDFVVTVAEVFQAGRHIDLRSGAPRVALFQVVEPLDLVDFTGSFATRAGCHQGIHNSPNREKTRAWSRASYSAWPETSGLLYRSKMGFGAPAIALWERAEHLLCPEPLLDRPLSASDLRSALRSAADELGYSLDPG